MNKQESPIINVASLCKCYTKKYAEPIEVLKNISFEVCRQTHTVITGESGSGKTTLLSMISGLDASDSGSICVDGVEVSGLTEQARARFRLATIGFVFQHHYLLQDFSALGNVMLPLLMNGEKKREAREKARNVLVRVGLEKRTTHTAKQLSGGECQRVAVARAIVHSPSLILADEPTGALDARNSEYIRTMLSELVSEAKATLVVATHDNTFLSIAHSHIHLEDGSLAFHKSIG